MRFSLTQMFAIFQVRAGEAFLRFSQGLSGSFLFLKGTHDKDVESGSEPAEFSRKIIKDLKPAARGARLHSFQVSLLP